MYASRQSIGTRERALFALLMALFLTAAVVVGLFGGGFAWGYWHAISELPLCPSVSAPPAVYRGLL